MAALKSRVYTMRCKGGGRVYKAVLQAVGAPASLVEGEAVLIVIPSKVSLQDRQKAEQKRGQRARR